MAAAPRSRSTRWASGSTRRWPRTGPHALSSSRSHHARLSCAFRASHASRVGKEQRASHARSSRASRVARAPRATTHARGPTLASHGAAWLESTGTRCLERPNGGSMPLFSDFAAPGATGMKRALLVASASLYTYDTPKPRRTTEPGRADAGPGVLAGVLRLPPMGVALVSPMRIPLHIAKHQQPPP